MAKCHSFVLKIRQKFEAIDTSKKKNLVLTQKNTHFNMNNFFYRFSCDVSYVRSNLSKFCVASRQLATKKLLWPRRRLEILKKNTHISFFLSNKRNEIHVEHVCMHLKTSPIFHMNRKQKKAVCGVFFGNVMTSTHGWIQFL